MPTPTTPTWISPAEGSTHDASVLLQWTASTVSGGGGNQSPTASVVDPAENGTVPAGTPYTFKFSVADPDGTISDVQVYFDGNPSAISDPVFNATSGYYEREYTLSGTGARTVRIDATDNGGATVASATRNFTVAAAGSLDPTVQSYVTATGIGTTEANRWNEFWLRLGNRDSEFSGSLQAALADAFCLRSAYNHGSGTTVRGLKGTNLTASGSPLPAWGVGGMTFAGGTGVLASAAGLVTGASALTFYGYATATGTPSGTTYLAAQFDTGIAGTLYLGRNSNGVNTNAAARDSAATLRTAIATGQWGATRASATAQYSAANTYVRARLLPAGTTVTETNAALTATTGETPFRIGNSAAGASGWLGEVTVVLAFTADLTVDDAVALDALVKATLGAGL